MAEKKTWSEKDSLIWDNVRRLSVAKGWNSAELARQSKTNPQHIQKIKNRTRGIGKVMQKRFAEALEIDEKLLLSSSLTDIPTTHNKPIPVISWVNAGIYAEPADAWPVGISEVADPVYSHHKTGPSTFGLIIEGESMLPRFMPGDIAIVDPSIRCDNGSPCVVWVNGEVSIKLFWDKEDEILLKPMNDKYPETVIRKDSKVDFRIIGKVVDISVKKL